MKSTMSLILMGFLAFLGFNHSWPNYHQSLGGSTPSSSSSSFHSIAGRRSLMVYPRVGRSRSRNFYDPRSSSYYIDKRPFSRQDFLNRLANKWSTTGTLRGAITEINDMTERRRRKRSLGGNFFLPGSMNWDDEYMFY